MFRNLPQSEKIPLSGCSQDPQFYSATTSYMGMITPLWYRDGCPLGAMFGFRTDMGVVPVPEESIHGYKFFPEFGIWVIAARGV